MLPDTAPSPAATHVDKTLGSPPVAGVASWLTRRRLRVLAYHDVPDQAAFERHVAQICAHWHPVSGTQVADWIHGGEPLPDLAVWLTFDDGRPDVVHRGLPVLEAAKVPATLYVCPSVIDSGAPFWWQEIESRPNESVEIAGEARAGGELIRALKQVDDTDRRAVIDLVRGRALTAPPPPQLVRTDLESWVASGREVGNHTWDHPILEQCSPAAQIEQIDRAHEWLIDFLGAPTDLFAYPNGDRTEVVASHLFRLRYRTAPLFDHRLVSRAPEPFEISRIRIDADAPLPRARALLSGAHSGLFHLAERRRSASARTGS